eukprot:Hpha_TRINITY_DN35791_c0_g1::TRINITY_DN35791_c0_g1_i1::g.139939::m.139939
MSSNSTKKVHERNPDDRVALVKSWGTMPTAIIINVMSRRYPTGIVFDKAPTINNTMEDACTDNPIILSSWLLVCSSTRITNNVATNKIKVKGKSAVLILASSGVSP